MQAEAIALINAIEQACDTRALSYGGVGYWPLVRLRLWTTLIQRMVTGKKAADADTVSNTGPAFAATGAAAEPVGPAALGLLRAAGSGATLPARADLLFFARPEEHSDKTASGMFAKVLDSVIERVPGPSAKLELSDPRTIGFSRARPSLFIDLGQAGAGLSFDPPSMLTGFTELKAAADKVADVTLDQAQLATDMGKILYFARIFEKLLRALGPKALVLSVYYHLVGMAWMLA